MPPQATPAQPSELLVPGCLVIDFAGGVGVARTRRTMRALGIRMAQLWGLVFGEAATVALISVGIGRVTGAVMAYMFVKILAPLFTIQPASLTVPADQLAILGTLILGGMLPSVAFAARSLRRINPVELLREE